MPVKMTVIRGGKEKLEAVRRKVESFEREWLVARNDPNLTFEQFVAVGERLMEAAREVEAARAPSNSNNPCQCPSCLSPNYGLDREDCNCSREMYDDDIC